MFAKEITSNLYSKQNYHPATPKRIVLFSNLQRILYTNIKREIQIQAVNILVHELNIMTSIGI